MMTESILTWLKHQLSLLRAAHTLPIAQDEASQRAWRRCIIEQLAHDGLAGEARWHLESYVDRIAREGR